MLKRPDAADIVDTGRFYLLVGNNEVFEMGQSAWAGANYQPTETVVTKDTCTISVIDINGRVVQTVAPDTKQVKTADTKKQLDVITAYITQTAQDENAFTRQLWLPPIDALILLGDLHKKYPPRSDSYFTLSPLIGEIDDPARQRRLPLYLDLTNDGNTVIYGAAGGGKAVFIETMTYDLLCTHSAKTLNMYLLDFGAETLRAFKNAPQVGDVVFSTELEKVVNLLKMLRKEVANRKKLFADWGGDHSSYCERSGDIVPNIVVVINNYSIFREVYHDYEDQIVSITQECAKYGMYFVFAVTGLNGIGYRVTQNCSKTFALQLNDESDYSSVVGRTGGLYPAKFKGRGLVNMDDVFEFQTAHISDPKYINEDIRTLCTALSDMPHATYAKRIPILPAVVDPAFFSNQESSLACFPVGVNKSSLNTEYISFNSSFLTLVSATGIEKTIPFVQGVAEVLSEAVGVETIVLDAGKFFTTGDNKKYEYLTAGLEEAVLALFELTLQRYKAHKNEGITSFDHKVYIIPSTPELCKQLSEDCIDKLNALFERGSQTYGLNIIICDADTDITAYTGQQWYQQHCAGNGIWVGDGVTAQYNFNITNATNDLRSNLDDVYGVIINNGKFKIAKILQSRLTVYDDEEGDNE